MNWLAFLLPSLLGAGTPVTHQEYVRKPVWTHMGRDAANRQVWIRLDQEGDDVKIAIFAGGKLVKTKEFESDGLLSDTDIPAVARIGRNWMLFFDTFGNNQEYTEYLLIDRRSFAFTGYETFDISDPTHFRSSKRIIEYRYLKYYDTGEPDPKVFFRRTGAYGYRRNVWGWDVRRSRFRKLGTSLVQAPPKWFIKRWEHEVGS